MDTHEIMTIKEVSEHLRVSERTILDWAQKAKYLAESSAAVGVSKVMK